MGRSKGKGSEYERQVARRLSRWWTYDENPNVFWRSNASGGFARVKSQGDSSFNLHHGDLSAMDPIGAPFLRVVTLELKRGYKQHTFMDVLDKPPLARCQVWEEWYEEVVSSQENAGSFSWMMLTRRDRRQDLVFFPEYLLNEIETLGPFIPFFRFKVRIRRAGNKHEIATIVGTKLEQFLKKVRPEEFKKLDKKIRKGKLK